MNSIWKYFHNYKAHCDNMKLASKIAKYRGCTLDGIYFYSNHKEADVIFPKELLRKMTSAIKS